MTLKSCHYDEMPSWQNVTTPKTPVGCCLQIHFTFSWRLFMAEILPVIHQPNSCLHEKLTTVKAVWADIFELATWSNGRWVRLMKLHHSCNVMQLFLFLHLFQRTILTSAFLLPTNNYPRNLSYIRATDAYFILKWLYALFSFKIKNGKAETHTIPRAITFCSNIRT